MTLSAFTVTIITKTDSPDNVLPNAPLEIRNRLANGTSGTLASIFSDAAGTLPITQTGATTDSLGQFTFYALPAPYNAVFDNNGTPVISAIDVGLTVVSFSSAINKLFPDTLAIAQADTDLVAGELLHVKENDGSIWLVVLDSSVTVNGRNPVSAVSPNALVRQGAEPSSSLIKNATNIDSTKVRTAIIKNRVGANQDNHILLWGDSHAWGQGAPENDDFVDFTNVSTHSAAVYQKGFMWRIEEYINKSLGWDTGRYGGGTGQLSTFVTNEQINKRPYGDPENGYPIEIQGGNVTISEESYLGGVRGQKEWYTPRSRFASATETDTYSRDIYREKAANGLFDIGVTKLTKCTAFTFNSEGKNRYWELCPNPDAVTYGGGGLIDLVYNNGTTGGLIMGVKDNSSQRIFVTSACPRPDWIVDGADVYIPGFGFAEIGSFLATNDSIQIRAVGGGAATDKLGRMIAPGTRIYPKAAAVGLMTIDMREPARVMYISVIGQGTAGIGRLRVGFTPNITSGFKPMQAIDTGAVKDNAANEWAWKFPTGLNAVLLVNSNGVLTATTAVVADADGILIDLDNTITDAGVRGEYIYRIDLGGRMQGRIYLELGDVSTDFVEFRGVVFDNNKVSNFSEGGHSVGAWLGDEASFNDPIRDHVADVLNYTPVQPSHIITQVPFVNEFLLQTPIATFKTRLQDFVDRFDNHLTAAAGINFNLVGVDHLFFTSLRNREIAFAAAAPGTITYDDYVTAVREFCEANDHAFVDCEAEIFRVVDSGRVDFDRMYNNSNHPSDLANEIIFRCLKQDYLQFMVG